MHAVLTELTNESHEGVELTGNACAMSMKGWSGFTKMSVSSGTFWKRNRPYARASIMGRMYGRQATPRITPSFTKFICEGHRFTARLQISMTLRLHDDTRCKNYMQRDLEAQILRRRSFAEGDVWRKSLNVTHDRTACCAANKGWCRPLRG